MVHFIVIYFILNISKSSEENCDDDNNSSTMEVVDCTPPSTSIIQPSGNILPLLSASSVTPLGDKQTYDHLD